MQPAQKLAEYADLFALGEDVRAEIVRGELHTLPSPRADHSKSQRSLGRFVGGPYDDDDGFGGPGGWWILVEMDVRLSRHNVVRPDLVGWRRARLPRPSGRPIDVVPDWICEVLSPSTAAYDRVTKRTLYAEAGVAHYWLVDPEARTLEALTLDAGRWRDAGAWTDGDVAHAAPFDELALDVSRLFFPKLERAAGDER